MKFFTLHKTYIKLKSEQLMYSTYSSIQLLLLVSSSATDELYFYHIIYQNTFLSFVKHIKDKDSPNKMLKLAVYSSVYFLPQSVFFLHITQDQKTFQD